MSVDLSEIRDERLAEELRGRGWRCIPSDTGADWETPAAFSRRHGRHKNYLCHLMRSGVIPPGIETTKGKTGRVILVRSTPVTEQWMKSRCEQHQNKSHQPTRSVRTNGAQARITDFPAKATESAFDRFWTAYPKHVGKIDAQKAWVAMKCEPLIERILAALSKCVKSVAWTKERGQFIPHPATWLRRGGWDDEMELLHRHGTLEEKDMPKVIRYG